MTGLNSRLTSMRLRIDVGTWTQHENSHGDFNTTFTPFKRIWAHVNSMPLTNCLHFEGSNERQVRYARGMYRVRVRSNSLDPLWIKRVNAVRVNDSLLRNQCGFSHNTLDGYHDGWFFDLQHRRKQ